MDYTITGRVIKEQREKLQLTQAELATKLCVSDKTISKWENAKGFPDVALLEPIATVFGISIAELLSGKAISNTNMAANMLRSKFYVCSVCGNVIHCMGEAVIHCHGMLLPEAKLQDTDEQHKIFVEGVEDDYYVRIAHSMTKEHYISFIAAISYDKIQLIKLYPEGNAEARIPTGGVKKIVFGCNQDGVFVLEVIKAIDAKDRAYDDTEERRALEDAAKRFFG